MRVPILSGRMIQASDRSDAPPVALVSQSLASRFWPGKSAIGQPLPPPADGPFDHRRRRRRRRDARLAHRREARHGLSAVRAGSRRRSSASCCERSPIRFNSPRSCARPCRPRTRNNRSSIFARCQRVVEDNTVGLRIASRGLGVMALVSCLLSTIGLYGLISFLTGLRTREIGLRMALGASRWDVIKLTGATAVGLAVTGVALARARVRGRASARAAAVRRHHQQSAARGGAGRAAGVVSLAAGYMPARRAANVDPTIALRSE